MFPLAFQAKQIIFGTRMYSSPICSKQTDLKLKSQREETKMDKFIQQSKETLMYLSCYFC